MADSLSIDRPRRQGLSERSAKRSGINVGLEFEDAHWWTEEWLEYIENVATPKELNAARSYVKHGNVLEVNVAPGMVDAKVQGRRKAPYQVRLYCELPTEEQLVDIRRRLSDRAIHGAFLLFGEMPENVKDIYAAVGAGLLPGDFARGRLMCSCPEPMDVCKHILAVLYVSAALIDRDPFVLLKLRGLEKEDLLRNLLSPRGAAAKAASAEERGMPIPSTSLEGDLPRDGGEGEGIPLNVGFYGGEALPEPVAAFQNDAPDSGDLPESRTPLFDFPLWRGEATFIESISPYYDSVRRMLREK